MMISSACYQSTLTLYFINELKIPESQSFTLYAAFVSIQAITSVFGGFLGGRLFNHCNSTLFGLLLMLIGMIFLGIKQHLALLTGLSCYALGLGILVPNSLFLVGKIYRQHHSGKDSGYTLAYTFFNLGAFIGFLIAGYGLASHHYRVNFFISAAALLLGLIVLFIFRKQFNHEKFNSEQTTFTRILYAIAIIGILLISALLIQFDQFTTVILLIAIFAITVWLLRAAKIESQNSPHVFRNTFTTILLLWISVGFWLLYRLQPTVINVFLELNTQRTFLGFTLPTSWLLSLNAIFDLLIGLCLSVYLIRLRKRKTTLNFNNRFSAGFLFIGLAFFCFCLAIFASNKLHLANLGFVVLAFFFISAGEMTISPAGYTMIGELITERWQATMIGFTRLITGTGALLAGVAGQLFVVSPKLQHQPAMSNPVFIHGFFLFACAAVFLGALLFGAQRLKASRH
jgi:POT family proton-dependent oligopeptide transporter